jgi:hypothetical protein
MAGRLAGFPASSLAIYLLNCLVIIPRQSISSILPAPLPYESTVRLTGPIQIQNALFIVARIFSAAFGLKSFLLSKTLH